MCYEGQEIAKAHELQQGAFRGADLEHCLLKKKKKKTFIITAFQQDRGKKTFP